jgi:hypothetical protein
MIIGLTGKKQSGKDTTYKIIKGAYDNQGFHTPVIRIGFADKVKEATANLLGLDLELIEKYKQLEDIPQLYIEGNGEDSPGNHIAISHPLNLSVRNILQRMGTEVGRNMFGQDFWLQQALSPNIDHSKKVIVVTDVRFDNEAEWIKNLGGYIWRIERESNNLEDSHSSEVPISDSLVDFTVNNNGDEELLEANVLWFLFQTLKKSSEIENPS